MGTHGINQNFTPFVSSTPLTGKNAPAAQKNLSSQGEDFRSLLQQEMQKKPSDLVFSKHAMQRMNERNLDVDSNLISRISEAVSRAGIKGIKNALILGENTAFIVNIPSKTVVTTMNSREMKSNIITNIDGTVIL